LHGGGLAHGGDLIHEVNTTRVDDQAAPDAGLLTRLRRRFDQGVTVGISTNLSRP